MEKRPKVSEYATDEEKELFNQSWERSKKQKKDCKNFAITTGLLLTSMAVAGAGVGALAAKGVGTTANLAAYAGQTVGQAAAHGTTHAFTHGVTTFGLHLIKDVGKHASFETMGLQAHHAAGAGAGLSTATLGLLEMINEGNEPNNNGKFVSKFMGKVIEKMKTYKLS